ncbi:hypothetical protein MPC4_60189 [Methylocella tundrae]|uniref:Uncharacterized protein n=1 Tax=Methylocella tundrae TaxID=227605 RepID=A0A8B6MCQ9_METTU|nr:hypothetical protein MPC1_2000003 [Methylocella tundrae]VTZ52099.1 hypothetical protein MPC4_60189 [Methylocella tundrae]
MVFDAKPSELELTFSDPVHEFDTSEGDPRRFGTTRVMQALHHAMRSSGLFPASQYA